MDFTRRTLPAQPYLYVERETPMEGPRIAEAMGSGFAELFAHLGQAGIAAQGAPMSV